MRTAKSGPITVTIREGMVVIAERTYLDARADLKLLETVV